ncbi:MAG: hypothetical protein HYR62_01140 [Actinobacteria bacterium]|nr:hypothetical protein [Actinomycetota bacterium]MBI3686665.1 hypothetical protein [Actinomycetota bacterium]
MATPDFTALLRVLMLDRDMSLRALPAIRDVRERLAIGAPPPDDGRRIEE